MTIEREPEEASSFTNRAGFRSGTTDFAGAIEDYSRAIQLDPDPDYYLYRGNLYVAQGKPEVASADYREAFGLDPSADRAMNLAFILGELGETDEALALIDEFDDYGDRHSEFVGVRADVLALADRADEGLAAIVELIAEQPGQGQLLNQACWYQARFSVAMESMMNMCNAAVEKAGLGAATLDSRALAWLQLGEMEKAVADADAALALAPNLLPTRYLRAFALRRQGDGSEEEFIKYFAKVWPGQALAYSKYGLKP